eukprot:scaffold91713_cov47-Cyclotella_meneghiniana.AAC.2
MPHESYYINCWGQENQRRVCRGWIGGYWSSGYQAKAKGHCVGALLDRGLDGAVFGVTEVDSMNGCPFKMK